MAVQKYKTLEQIRGKIQRELDLEQEDFVRANELLEYINEAIKECEAEIHTLYDDYFLTRQTYQIVQGQDQYTLPDDIYAHKIRRIVYNSGFGGQVWPIKRMRDWIKFEEHEYSLNYTTEDVYQYFLLNPSAAAPVILLSPVPNVNLGIMRVYYLRAANILVEDSDICDIPEFYNFLYAYVRYKVYEKEVHPGMASAAANLERQRNLMTSTLQSMIPDADNEIEMDNRLYQDMI